MHVAVVTTSYPLSRESTSGIFIKRLVDNLPESIIRTVITPCPDYRPATPDTANTRIRCFRYAPLAWQRISHQPGGIPVAFRRNRWLLLLLPFMLLSMLAACVRTGRHADVIHANWSLNGLVAGIAGALTGTPVITTLRGSDVDGLEDSLPRRLVLACCVALSKRVVTVSKAICLEASTRFPKLAAKFSAIPNGVGNEFLDISTGKAPNDDTLHITAIGNLSSNKRMDTVISAAQKMTGGNAPCVHIIGNGPELPALEIAAAEAASHGVKVDLAGTLPPAKIPGVLAETDIFVLASHSEGRPNVILEAMAAGLPVVAADIPGVRELVTDMETGLLFESGNIGQLASRLVQLRDNPQLRDRLGLAAREFIISNGFTWQQCATAYAGVYTSVRRHAGAAG